MKQYKIICAAVCGVLLGGCATTPPFNCGDARAKIVEETENAVKAGNEFHAASGQKDGKYYGIKAARTAACVGSLGLLCDAADKVASENSRIEKSATAAKEAYAKSSGIVKGLRSAMEQNNCEDIPPGLKE